MSSSVPVIVSPMDGYNRELVRHLHPADWVNPKPADRYDLVIIGAGPAGLIVAAGAAGLGAKVALVEKHLMGGDCLNVGCVPSKSLIRSARAAVSVKNAHTFGVQVPASVDIDFPQVMERLRRLRSHLSPNDSVSRYQHTLGVDVFLGAGRFTDATTVDVAGAALRFRKAVIATGARAAQPDIPGLTEAGYLTNETVFSLTERPLRLAVIGAGPVGCELAQTFQRLGSNVVLFHKNAQILDREDVDAATILQQTFLREGMKLVLDATLQRVEVQAGAKILHYEVNGQAASAIVDEILVATGRAPNVEGLNLEQVGVRFDVTGIQINDYLQTTNPRIFAAGDICLDWQFTHAADASARLVIKNALFSPWGMGRSRLSSLTMPRVTYTDPEIAQVGLNERSAHVQGIEVKTFCIPLSEVDRAVIEGETAGFVKIHVRQGTDKIMGATIVAAHAGEWISEITLAIANKIGLGKVAEVVHPYPTQAEAIRKAADAYRRTKLTPRTARFLKLLMKFS